LSSRFSILIISEPPICEEPATACDAAKILRDAAQAYKVDVDAIVTKTKAEFAAKEKSKNAHKAAQKSPTKQQAKEGKHRAAASFPCYCQHIRASGAHFARFVFRPVALFREFEFSFGNQA